MRDIALQSGLQPNALNMGIGATTYTIAKSIVNVLCQAHGMSDKIEECFDNPERMPYFGDKVIVFCMLNDLWLTNVMKKELENRTDSLPVLGATPCWQPCVLMFASLRA